MATRSQSTIADLEKKFDDRHENITARLEQMSASIANLEQLHAGVDEIRKLLRTQSQNQGDNSIHNDHHSRMNQNDHNTEGHHHHRDTNLPHNHYSTRISKVEFPRFDGTQVREWMYKCEQFFLLDGTPVDSKVRLASIHLDGIALQWHLNYMRNRFDIYPPWSQYVADVTARFGEAYEDPLFALIQVKQSGPIQEYIDAFELALTQVSLIPEHSLSIFLAGLEHGTQMHVRMFNPTTISHAATLAKLHEASKLSTPKLPTRPPFPSPRPTTFTPKLPSPSQTPTSAQPHNTQKPLFNKVPRTFNAAEMADRHAKGLCMFCDEPFTPGHHLKHKQTQMLIMEMEDDDSVTNEIDPQEEVGMPNPLDEVPQLSLNAMAGISNYHTMRVTGMHDKKLLQILLDSGSTHNFLDLEVAKKLGCKLEKVTSLPVAAGGGTTLEAPYICRDFTWQLQQTRGPDYTVPLGRRDGLSFSTSGTNNLPSPFNTTGVTLNTFAPKNFDVTDVVALSGAHTFGRAHCGTFFNRLSPQDPNMDKTLAKKLQATCPSASSGNTTNLDLRTPNVFDNKYYLDLMNRQGVFTSDQDLLSDERTNGLVNAFAVNQTLFFEKFVDAVIKLSQLDVLTGNQGEIRDQCNVINNKKSILTFVVEEGAQLIDLL